MLTRICRIHVLNVVNGMSCRCLGDIACILDPLVNKAMHTRIQIPWSKLWELYKFESPFSMWTHNLWFYYGLIKSKKMRFLFVNALSELPGIWKSILRVSYRLGLPSLDSYRLRSHNSALHHHTEDAHVGTPLSAQVIVLMIIVRYTANRGGRMPQWQRPHRSSPSARIYCVVMNLVSYLTISAARVTPLWFLIRSRRYVTIPTNCTAGIWRFWWTSISPTVVHRPLRLGLIWISWSLSIPTSLGWRSELGRWK